MTAMTICTCEPTMSNESSSPEWDRLVSERFKIDSEADSISVFETIRLTHDAPASPVPLDLNPAIVDVDPPADSSTSDQDLEQISTTDQEPMNATEEPQG